MVKKIFSFVLVLVTLVMSVFTCVNGYYVLWGKNKLPSAVTSTFATTVTNPETGEEMPVIEANYYDNINNSGYSVVELLFNCYSGISKQSIYSRGFQLVFDKDGNQVYYNDPADGKQYEVFQYDRNGIGQSFLTGHKYTWGDPMLIDIDGTTYAVKLDGSYSINHRSVDSWKIARTVGLLGLNLLWENDNFYKEWTTTHNYTFKDLLLKLKDIIKSSSNGTGDSVISLIDLGDFLHVYSVDDNGQISATPLGINTLQNSYFTISTHYDTRGIVWAEQSLFDSVAGDNLFNISGIDNNVTYWTAKTNIELTEKDFIERYSVADNGYYYSLSTEKINELKNFENINININFNVSNFTKFIELKIPIIIKAKQIK